MCAHIGFDPTDPTRLPRDLRLRTVAAEVALPDLANDEKFLRALWRNELATEDCIQWEPPEVSEVTTTDPLSGTTRTYWLIEGQAAYAPEEYATTFPDTGHGPCSDCQDDPTLWGRFRAWLAR